MAPVLQKWVFGALMGGGPRRRHRRHRECGLALVRDHQRRRCAHRFYSLAVVLGDAADATPAPPPAFADQLVECSHRAGWVSAAANASLSGQEIRATGSRNVNGSSRSTPRP